MARNARLVQLNIPHHITQRGNNRWDVFLTDKDREYYLSFLRMYARRFRLDILAFCLMTNHVHLVAIPRLKESLALCLGQTHGRHARSFNARHGCNGHLWQERFYSCGMDEARLLSVIRYVECNPVRAGLVRQAWEYPWSSASAHIGQHYPSGLLDLELWHSWWNAETWKEILTLPEDVDELKMIRKCTLEGQFLTH